MQQISLANRKMGEGRVGRGRKRVGVSLCFHGTEQEERAYLFEIPFPYAVVYFIGTGAEKLLPDDGEVETLLVLEGIKPFAPCTGLVYNQGPLAILLQLLRVNFDIEEKGSGGFKVSTGPCACLVHEVEEDVPGI